MRVEYDPEADAAYLYLSADAPQVETTVLGEDEAEGINLDFDKSGKLVGIEVLDAKARLPTDLLK